MMFKQMMAAGMLAVVGLVTANAQDQTQTPPPPAQAQIEKQGDVVEAIKLSAGPAEFRFYRKVWQAVSVTTPGGKKLNIVDPLFYSSQQNDKPTGSDAYWTKPESWDSQLTFEVVDRAADAPQGVATIHITGKRPGLVKEVYVTQYPGESVVYVVNRIKAEETFNLHDPQMIYMAREVDNTMHLSEMTLDGVMVDGQSKVQGKRGAFMYLGTSNTSLGLAAAPASEQKTKMREMFHHFPQKTGRELRILGIAGQQLKAGETVEIRYALWWGDGNQLRQVTAWIDDVADGKHNDRFYPGK